MSDRARLNTDSAGDIARDVAEAIMGTDAISLVLSEADQARFQSHLQIELARCLKAALSAWAEPVAVKPTWRCFHCGDEFSDKHSARMHFGRDESATPACQIKGAEGGLVEALRRAENDAADAWAAIHNETTDTAKAFHAQAARHQEQLRAVEQLGYDRGIADAKSHPETLGIRSTLVASPAETEAHQDRVAAWMLECFGAEIAADKIERADRFIEEALELAQATGWPAERGHALVDYVFSRPVGEIGQEVGGVMVTLAALCNVFGVGINAEARREVGRITQPDIVLKIRAKQAAKPTGSALPVDHHHPAPSIPAGYRLVPEEPTGEWLSRARHWIDRYAAGIDDEPQLNRIYSELPSAPAQQQEGDDQA